MRQEVGKRLETDVDMLGFPKVVVELVELELHATR